MNEYLALLVAILVVINLIAGAIIWYLRHHTH